MCKNASFGPLRKAEITEAIKMLDKKVNLFVLMIESNATMCHI